MRTTEDPVVEVKIGTYRNTVRLAVLFKDEPLKLEGGDVLRPVEVAYETWGRLSEARGNAILLVHALTGDSHAASHGPSDRPGWFEGALGGGRGLDPDRHFIVCANWLGSNYGTTGPTSIDPSTGRPYGAGFPQMTIGDVTRVHKALADHLGVGTWAAAVGGSVGGMVVLDYAARYPGSVAAIVPIATSFRASPWVIAFHEIMRRILSLGRDSGSREILGRALEAARMVGIVTYRSRAEFVARYRRARADLHWQDRGCSFAVESYLRYQGEKLDQRFDPTAYEFITRAADMFDLGETHGSLGQALSRIRSRVLAVGIDTDHLFPPDEQEEIVARICEAGGDARLGVIASENGHDAFLIEWDQLNRLLREFLA
ncbi:MAG: homoserine O-acetyltransferase [Deltaproteobacteria bacterium]|nr:homoserine O-acetyltransferase [Deltaproteobacteria bacterium]